MSSSLSTSSTLLLILGSTSVCALPPDVHLHAPVLDPVVVTTTHAHAPLQVAMDARAPLQPVPAQDGAQVLQPVPGFAVIRKGGTAGDPVLRGMAGSRLGILIDGEGLLGGCGQRMDPPTAYVYPAAFDRITIIKGPQTVLYGPGNAAGVVRFERDVERLPGPGATLHGSLTIGSFDRFDAAVDTRAGTAAAQARATVTYSRSGDMIDGDGREIHSAYRRWSASPTLVWTPDAHTTAELSMARGDGEVAYADRGMDGSAFERDNLGLRLRRTGLTELVNSVELQLYRNAVDHVMDNFTLRPFAPTPMMPGRSVSNPDRLTWGGRLQAELTPDLPWSLIAGIDHQDNRHRMRSTANEEALPFRSLARARQARFQQSGVFAETRIGRDSGTDRSRVVAGVRVDDWTAGDDRARLSTGMSGAMANPGAGARRTRTLPAGFVRIEHDLQASGSGTRSTVYAGIGHVQRFPDYWELFSKESLDSLSAFARSPERTTQLDTGWLYSSSTLDVSVALFASWIEDYILIENGVIKPGAMGRARTTTVSRNIAASTRGGEATLRWRFTQGWMIDGSLAHVHGGNETDHRPLAQMPPLEGRVGLTYSRPTWSASGLVRGVAAQDRTAVGQGNIAGQDIGPSSGFAVISLNTSWRPTTHLRLSAGVDNLFDRTYAEHISRAGAMVAGFDQTTRVNEPGRFVWLKLDYSR